MADFLTSRARRLFQYVNLHGTTVASDLSANINSQSHLSNGLSSSVRVTNNATDNFGEERVRINNLNGASSLPSTDYLQTGGIANMTKVIRQQKQKRCIMIGTLICGLAALIVIVLVWKQDAGNKKRAAILERYAMDPQTASFASATSLGSASLEGNHKRTFQLHEFVYNTLVPARFNGTWVSDSEIIYSDANGGIKMLNLENNKAIQLMSSSMTAKLRPKALHMSSDKNYLLIKRTSHSVFRRSSYGAYSILQLGSNGRHLGKSFELKPSSFHSQNVEGNHFQIRYVKWAPTGNGLVYVDYHNNIFYRKAALERDVQLTNNGMPGQFYNGIPDWVFEEEVFEDNFAIWWSPDASKLVFGSFNDTLVNSYILPEYGYWRKPILQYPDYTELRYPKVNTTNPKVNLWLVDLTSLNGSGQITKHTEIHPPVSLTSNGEEIHFSWVTWADANHFAVTWMNRVQNTTIISLCGATAKDSPTDCSQKRNEIFSQSMADGWIEYKYRILFNPNPPNPKNKDFVVILAAPFIKHHYRQLVYVTQNDQMRTYLTKVEEAEVVEILAWTKENYIYYTSTLPLQPGSRHIFRIRSPTAAVNGMGTNNGFAECLTCSASQDDVSISQPFITPNSAVNHMAYLHREPCNYFTADFSISKGYYAMTCSGPDIPWTCIHKTVKPNGNQRHDKFVMVYEDNTELEVTASKYALPTVKIISVPVSNSDQKANVKLYLPPAFDASRKYPLIVYVYGGPGFQVVDDQWNQYDYQTYLTGQGFIYALVDPKGSGFQGNDWRFSVHRAFGTAEVNTTIEVAEHLQNKFKYIDKEHTGIWGWSYGGFLSLSALISDTRSIFKCGASVAPVTDWSLYDTYYTERYMGLLSDNEKGYDRARVFDRLDNLKLYGKRYFVAHGTHDDNVHFQQSMFLSEALEEKDILFRQHAYPDQDHSIGNYHKHLYHTLTDFFQNDCFRTVTGSG